MAETTDPIAVDNKEEDGKLIEKDADEDDKIENVDRSTYTRVLNETGGIVFWVLYLCVPVVAVMIWDEQSSFWSRFAEKSPEE